MGVRRIASAAAAGGLLAAAAATAGAQERPLLTLSGALSGGDAIAAWQYTEIPRAEPPPGAPPTPPPAVPGRSRSEVRLDFGYGEMDLEHTTGGDQFDEDTRAMLVRVSFEAYASTGFGGGLRAEAIASDEELFEDSEGADDTVDVSDVFLYLGYRIGGRKSWTPFRLGVVWHELLVEDDATSIDLEYDSFAVRFEAEPEFRIHENDSILWTGYCLVGMAFGTADFESGAPVFDGDTDASFFGLDLGSRIQWGSAMLGVGYVFRLAEFSEGDFEFLVAPEYELSSEFSGVVFTLGVRW